MAAKQEAEGFGGGPPSRERMEANRVAAERPEAEARKRVGTQDLADEASSDKERVRLEAGPGAKKTRKSRSPTSSSDSNRERGRNASRSPRRQALARARQRTPPRDAEASRGSGHQKDQPEGVGPELVGQKSVPRGSVTPRVAAGPRPQSRRHHQRASEPSRSATPRGSVATHVAKKEQKHL
jgi:hypothetical protein